MQSQVDALDYLEASTSTAAAGAAGAGRKQSHADDNADAKRQRTTRSTWPEPPDWVKHIFEVQEAMPEFALPEFQRPVRIMTPCAGTEAPCRALDEMGIEHVSAGAYDKDEKNTQDILEHYHGAEGAKTLHVGKDVGNVDKVSVASLQDADLLVAGPPCPPWSSIGQGHSFDDTRANTFLAVRRWVGGVGKARLLAGGHPRERGGLVDGARGPRLLFLFQCPQPLLTPKQMKSCVWVRRVCCSRGSLYGLLLAASKP